MGGTCASCGRWPYASWSYLFHEFLCTACSRWAWQMLRELAKHAA
jgi:hypothetical protein